MNVDQRFGFGSRTLFFMLTVAAVGILPAGGASAQAQPTQTPAATPAPTTAPAELLKSEELEQLLAPIALYPDALLSNVLIASTYPLEAIEADRWAKANKSLKGDALKTAVAKQSWDDNVKQLVATPSVLDMMSANLEWTRKLGDAVLAQQADVMDAVQRLRARADSQNTLKTTSQQKVTKQTQQGKQVIVIEPAQPETVYVPYYNPQTVYGTWPYPSYPPLYYPQPLWYPGTLAAGAIGFGLGVAVGAAWGGAFGWGNNNIAINRNVDINNVNNRFQHKVEHRGGVRYNNAQVAQKFGKGERVNAQERMDFRGRDGQQVLGDRSGDRGDRAGDRGDRGGDRGDRVGDRGDRGGDRGNVGDRGGNRQNAADRGGNRPNAGDRGGNRPNAGNRPAGGGGSRPKAAQRPAGGRESGLGNVGQGRNAMAHADRGRASMGGGGPGGGNRMAGAGPRMGGGGPGMGAGGGGGFRGGGGGGGFRGGGGGGFRGGGGGGGRRSDLALKHDVVLLGTLNNGLGFYRFAYHGSDKAYVGVMAQEVQQVMPSAVLQGSDGYLRVRYEKLGLRFETYEQWLASGSRIPVSAKAGAQ